MQNEQVNDSDLTKGDVAEKARLLAVVYKQLITLNASAIGLVVLFGENFVEGNRLANSILALALLVFLASLLASFMMFFRLTLMQRPDEDEEIFANRTVLALFWISFMGFVVGLLCLITIAWFNLVSTIPAIVVSVIILVILIASPMFLIRKMRNK